MNEPLLCSDCTLLVEGKQAECTWRFDDDYDCSGRIEACSHRPGATPELWLYCLIHAALERDEFQLVRRARS